MPQIHIDHRLSSAGSSADADTLTTRESVEGIAAQMRWLNVQDAPVSDWRPVGQPQSVFLEYSDSEGRLAQSEEFFIPSIETDVPDDAVVLQVQYRGETQTNYTLDSLMSGSLPAPAFTPFGMADAQFRLGLISERFDSEANFLQIAEEAFEHFQRTPPFGKLIDQGQFAIDALFWPSDSDNGLFQTDDSMVRPDRTFYGNRQLARELLLPHLASYRASVIMINSRVRGGAGSTPGYSAWSSIGSNDWRQIAVHEVGHGFGLADEYSTAGPNIEYISQPNVTQEPVPSRTPWRSLVTLTDNPAPSYGIGESIPQNEAGIGSFAGAFYRADWFRPTAHCLMRETKKNSSFCAVCRQAIENYFSAEE